MNDEDNVKKKTGAATAVAGDSWGAKMHRTPTASEAKETQGNPMMGSGSASAAADMQENATAAMLAKVLAKSKVIGPARALDESGEGQEWVVVGHQFEQLERQLLHRTFVD